MFKAIYGIPRLERYSYLCRVQSRLLRRSVQKREEGVEFETMCYVFCIAYTLIISHLLVDTLRGINHSGSHKSQLRWSLRDGCLVSLITSRHKATPHTHKKSETTVTKFKHQETNKHSRLHHAISPQENIWRSRH